MWRIEYTRHLYKPLRAVLVGFLLLLVAVPLLQECTQGIFRGEGCHLQPTWTLFTNHYVWTLPLLIVLFGILVVSRRGHRLHQARQRFALLKPASELVPENLDFRTARYGEEPGQDKDRPLDESFYIQRTAAEYGQRDAENPHPRYDEEALMRVLKSNGDFEGFLLIGPPLDGKSRTLYHIVKRMQGYDVLRPYPYEKVPEAEDFSLVLGNRQVVLLLDDLTQFAEEDTLNLRAFVERLAEHANSWALASACQDEPQLGSVKDSTKQSMKWLYDKIPLKLSLLEASVEDKRQLAERVGTAQDDHDWEQLPALGHIVMEEPMRDMKARFDRLSYEQQDVLRALKLLADAGIPTLSHNRIKAILEDESLFDRQEVEGLRDQLRWLAEQSFLRSVSSDRVEPEPAYLQYVVPYASGAAPLEYFEALGDLLERSSDSEGLFYFGNTHMLVYGDYRKALEAYEAALEISPDDAQALNNKGNALAELGKYEEALEAYDAALEIKPDYADALYNKGETLLTQGRFDKAVESFDAAIRISPDDVHILIVKAAVLVMQERRDEAIESLCAAWHKREQVEALPEAKRDAFLGLFASLGMKPEEC